MKRFFLALAIFATASTATIDTASATQGAVVVEHWQNPGNRQHIDEKLEEFYLRLYLASDDEVKCQQIAQEMSEWVDTLSDADAAYVMSELSKLMNEANPNHEGVDTVALDNKINEFVDRLVQAQLNSDSATMSRVQSELQAWMQTLSEDEQIYVLERFSAILSDYNQMQHDVISRKVDVTEAEIEAKIDGYYARLLYCTSEREADKVGKEMGDWIKTLNIEDSLYAQKYMNEVILGGADGEEVPEERKAEIRAMVDDYLNEVMLAAAKGDNKKLKMLEEQMLTKTQNFTTSEMLYYMKYVEECTKAMMNSL
jgi:hypothetical protein